MEKVKNNQLWTNAYFKVNKNQIWKNARMNKNRLAFLGHIIDSPE